MKQEIELPFKQEVEAKPVNPRVKVEEESICVLQEIGYKLGTRANDCAAQMNEDLEKIE